MTHPPVAILAGGLGTRLAEETDKKPKALVRIGDAPVLRHVIWCYARQGFGEFHVALGYKGAMVEAYFREAGFASGERDHHGAVRFEAPSSDPFAPYGVTCAPTGERADTGGRVKRLQPLIGDRRFMLTWCDGLADIDFHAELAFHERHGGIVTLTATHPPPRFGKLALEDDAVVEFREKEIDKSDWINGAFFVSEPEIFQRIQGDDTSFERGPLTELASEGALKAYRHEGFWRCMDTLNEARALDLIWRSGDAPWAPWRRAAG